MSGLDHQQLPLHVRRDTVARILSLLQTLDETSIDLGETETLGPAELHDTLIRAQRRHRASSLFKRLPFGESSGDQILGPRWGVPSTGAVILAFHAGGELDINPIADSFGISSDDVGRELYDARRAVIGAATDACGHMRSRVGRYADQSLPREEMVALVNHVHACDECTTILYEFRSLDERIREYVESAPIAPVIREWERSRLTRKPLLVLVPLVLAVTMAIAALAAVGFGATSESSAAPLFAVVEDDSHRGWLILSSEQEVMAIDLESGERRRILDYPAHDWWNPFIISPGAELAVRWEEYSRGEERVGALRAYDMQGNRQYLHRWFGVRARTFSGWLDDRTVLFAERGPIRRVGVENDPPDEFAPSLIAADLETGAEWVVYQGPMDRAVPSPDGQYLAIVHPAPSPWPGKSVEILYVTDGEAGETISSLDYRHLSWPGRMVWSHDSERIFIPAIHRDDVPDKLPQQGDPAPGTFDLERLHLVAIGVDGVVFEFDTLAADGGWVVPQAIHPGGQSIAVVHNETLDRDRAWYHGVIDLTTGNFEHANRGVPGSRWWNSESIWSPEGDDLIVQQFTTERFSTAESSDQQPGSLILQSFERERAQTPLMVFQDTSSLDLRIETGLGLLRWVSDDAMRDPSEEPPGRPRPGTPSTLSQATSDQQLTAESSIAATGRYVLLSQHDPDVGSRERLIHLQAWAGTESELSNTGDFTWLPREPAVIGVTTPDPDEGQGSRLVFVATDRTSSLHSLRIDPAGVGAQTNLSYRRPVFSPNGANIAFFVYDEDENGMQLWVDRWNSDPQIVDTWSYPDEIRVHPSLNVQWTGDHEFIYTTVPEWDSGYPAGIKIMRGNLTGAQFETNEIRKFTARGRDRGIDLIDFEIGKDRERIAFRLRHFTGRDPEEDVADSILVGPTADTSQGIEIIRTNSGDGMTWLSGDEWLLAGIGNRIALLEATGLEIEYVSDSPAAFPVQVGPREIWYQDLSDEGRIMRMTFE
jgi:hypothetical protein